MVKRLNKNKATTQFDNYEIKAQSNELEPATNDEIEDEVEESKNLQDPKYKGAKSKCKAKRRSRKSYDDLVVLLKYFKQDPSWSRKTVQKLKKELSMKTSQIYKWGYDQKLKIAQEKKSAVVRKHTYPYKRETDVYMADRSIKDYNDAVVKIMATFGPNKITERVIKKRNVIKSGTNEFETHIEHREEMMSMSSSDKQAYDDNECSPAEMFSMPFSERPEISLDEERFDDYYYEFV